MSLSIPGSDQGGGKKGTKTTDRSWKMDWSLYKLYDRFFVFGCRTGTGLYCTRQPRGFRLFVRACLRVNEVLRYRSPSTHVAVGNDNALGDKQALGQR